MRIPLVVRLLTWTAALQIGIATAVVAGDSPWLVRSRLIDVAPNESSTLSIGGAATVESTYVPELDIIYFWHNNFATELILATSKHTMGAVGTALGDLDLGHVWALPPTLLLQYHANPDGRIRPYVGVGLNYTIFYSADAGALSTIDYSNSFGYAFQGGVDIGITETWAFNLDVKKVYIQSDLSINGGAVTADANIDPWVFGAGLAYRF